MQRSTLFWLAIALALLACNVQRVLDPSLPTPTPSSSGQGDEPDTGGSSPLQPLTPTPEPSARIEAGDRALFYGDWDRALQEYQIVYDTTTNLDLQAAALLGIGRARYEAGNYAGALESLQQMADNYPDSADRGLAFFALGQTYDELDRFAEAASAYEQYLNLRANQIDSYVLERRADSLWAAKDYQNAINTYQAALSAPRVGDTLHINVKIGNTYALLGDFNTAIVTYQDVFNRTSNDFVKAQMQLYMGQAYAASGQTQQAHDIWQEAVANYPLSYDTYLALIELVDANQPVNELSRGLIDYFAGQYSLALAAFDRYLQAAPDEHNDTAHYYKGLTLRALGEYQDAIDEWDEQIRDHPNDTHFADAYEEKGFTQWAFLDQYANGSQTFLDFVAAAPADSRAGEFLFNAARVAEINGDLPRAAELWQRGGVEYPASEYGFLSFFYSGITRYQLGEHAAAEGEFQSALGLARNPEEQSQAVFWIGKSQAARGEPESAMTTWQQAAQIDPTGYYSERAKEILTGQLPLTSIENYSLTYDEQGERIEAENWMKSTFALPEDVDLSPAALLEDSRMWRGTELWRLGLYNEARLEFESLRSDLSSDPAGLFRLAVFFTDLGLYRSGIIAARQVLDLAGMDDAATLNAPVYFNRIRFGIYFGEIVLPVTQTHDFEPLFFYSVMRQESLFEGFVTSSAGARGLMQIIPTTGQEIFNRNGWPPNYTAEDLYRPLVSVTYGADYLAAQRNLLEGDLYAALAAYNGGPGNALAWRELANGDPDLFVEVVRFQETRNYIRSIYEIFAIYRGLYEVDN